MNDTVRRPIEKPLPPVTLDLYQYASAMGWEVCVDYRHDRDPRQRSYSACLHLRGCGSAWIVEDGLTKSARGRGTTPEEAIAAYERTIAGRAIVFLDDGEKRNYQVPPGLGGGQR